MRALINREEPADREEQNGDHEGPEIARLAVPKRVFCIGSFPGTLDAHKQQELIAAICYRMTDLSNGTTATGEICCHRLGNGDPQISEEGVHDRLGGVTSVC